MARDTVPVKVFPSGKQGSRVDFNCWNTTPAECSKRV